ncbi:MAG: hypothetical protein KBT63_01475 [Porticoccaceae bacterium]|nr:hypothetical protein [Porticoccaceae bacterium]
MGIAWAGYRDFTLLEQASQIDAASEVRPQSTDAAGKGLSIDNFALVSNLFGKEVEIQTQVQENIPETRLDLVLKGTFTHDSADMASALIAEKNGSSKRYFTGDEIASGVELISVQAGAVVLRRNGRDESLKLPLLSDTIEREPTKMQAVTRNNSRVRPASNPDTQAIKDTRIKEERNKKLKERLAKLRNKQQE